MYGGGSGQQQELRIAGRKLFIYLFISFYETNLNFEKKVYILKDEISTIRATTVNTGNLILH